MTMSRLKAVNLDRTRKTLPDVDPELLDYIEKNYKLYHPFRTQILGSNGTKTIILKSQAAKVLLRGYKPGTSVER